MKLPANRSQYDDSTGDTDEPGGIGAVFGALQNSVPKYTPSFIAKFLKGLRATEQVDQTDETPGESRIAPGLFDRLRQRESDSSTRPTVLLNQPDKPEEGEYPGPYRKITSPPIVPPSSVGTVDEDSTFSQQKPSGESFFKKFSLGVTTIWQSLIDLRTKVFGFLLGSQTTEHVAPPPCATRRNMGLKELTANLAKDVNSLDSLLAEAAFDKNHAVDRHLEAASRACAMLQEVLNNEAFRSSIRKLTKAQTQLSPADIKELEEALDQLDAFLEQEADLLKDYNLSKSRIDKIITLGRKVVKQVQLGQVSHFEVFSAIERVRRLTYQLATDLKEQTSAAEKRRRTVRILKKAIWTGGGVIIALVNVQAQLTGELDPAPAILSGHIGAGIIGAAASAVMDLIGAGSA